MSNPYDTYTSPLATRNASADMLGLWSARHKFNTWRRIWLAVAEAQHELGLPVTKEQVEELRAVVNRPGGITDDEIKAAERYERDLRHDVMAHVHALGDSCPKAKGIIHLGMTSQDVVCNADLLVLREAIGIVATKVARAIVSLGDRAKGHVSTPALGFTHYQPAQPVTMGRRMCMWANDLVLCFRRVDWRNDSIRDSLALKGLRGATGTQASYLSLADGAGQLVDELEVRVGLGVNCQNLRDEIGSIDPKQIANTKVANQAFYERSIAEARKQGDSDTVARLTAEANRTVDELARERVAIGGWYLQGLVGQTYPRVIDTFILADLASVAAVLHKIATDIRLLCNRKELDEPFEDKQIGSSAMPYKRNPMRCERICGLARFVMNLVGNAYDTAATQWLERTLDDSSNRRLSLPEAFLALDGALDLMHNVASGLVVHEAMVRKNLMAELPFMATENILMACVKLSPAGGGDRQHYHELIRAHAQAAGLRVKSEGLDNDLIERLKADKNFWSAARGGPLTAELDFDGVLDPMKYIGRSVEQTERFIKDVVEPLRTQYADALAKLNQSAPHV